MKTLSRVLAVAAVLLGLVAPALVTASPASAADDYAYRSDTSQGADPWGFTKRQCVSFAAARLARSGHPLSNAREHWGDAAHWAATAKALHDTVSTRPVVGAIAQWGAGERSPYYAHGSRTANGWVQAGSHGHVAVVTNVYSDGSVRVEQYNLDGSRAWSAMQVKAPRYLYVGVR